MDAFCQSVGLRGGQDKREWDLAVAVVSMDTGIGNPTALPPREVRAHVQGILTGLLLAQATGWMPPTPDNSE